MRYGAKAKLNDQIEVDVEKPRTDSLSSVTQLNSLKYHRSVDRLELVSEKSYKNITPSDLVPGDFILWKRSVNYELSTGSSQMLRMKKVCFQLRL